MTSTMEAVTSIEDQVLEAITSVQEPVVGLVGKVAEYVAGVLPDELPELPFAEQIPSLNEVVESNFAFAQRLLDANKDFANAILDAVAPLLRTEQPKAKPVAKTVKAA